MTYEHIPAELKQAKRWIHWRWDDDGNKRPYNPRGHHWMRVNDSANWLTFEHAKTYRVKDGGLGFALRWQDDRPNFAVVDLDDCITEMGGPNKEAQEIIRLTDSYTEISPSGTGVKIFCRIEEPVRGIKVPGFEILTTVYATVTGMRLDDYPGCSTQATERTLWLQEQSDWYRLLRDLERPYGSTARLDPEAEVPDGMRNESLFRHACSLRATGASPEEIEYELLGINSRCQPPLDEREIIRIAHSANRYASE